MSHRQISHYVGAYPTTFLPSAAEFMGLPNEFGVFQCIEADDPIYSVMRKSKPICNKGCLGSVHSVENRMIQVRNCFLKEKRTSYRTYVIGAPATLEIIRWRWKCEQCGNRFWDDYTPLLGMSKDTTIALRQYIGKSALQNSFEELSTRYKVSADVVKQCFNAEIEKRDAERLWKTPQVLALLTLTFRKESYCLCISADKAELLEMFLWSDVQMRNDFAKKIKDKKKIQKILVGTDKIVHEWAMKNFPSTPILVDKIRIVSLLETALDDVIYDKKNALSPEYNTLCKRRNWLQTASDKLCIRLHGNEVKEICQKFSDVDTSVQLKEKMSSMYTVPAGQEKVFDEWVQAVPHQIIPFYVLVDPFKELRKEIVDFAIAYYNVNRTDYENAIEKSKTALTCIAHYKKTSSSARKASWSVFRGKALYGVMDKINEKSQQQISLTFTFMKQTEMLNRPIMLKNFGIPLALFAWYVYEVFGMNEERPRDYESETWSNDYPNVNIPRRKYEYVEPDEAEIMIEDFGQLRFGENKLNCIKIEK